LELKIHLQTRKSKKEIQRSKKREVSQSTLGRTEAEKEREDITKKRQRSKFPSRLLQSCVF